MTADCRIGVGLRSVHYSRILSGPRGVARWYEAISENYMDSEGRPVRTLEAVRRDFPLALHGVSLSIGSPDGLDAAYLSRLRALVDRVEPFVVSDHLCWTGAHASNTHDLLPLPYTKEALAAVVARVHEVQERLGRTIALENVSSYLTWPESEMTEQEFLVSVARGSGCRILLDVNNVFVNATNHGFDAERYLDSIPAELIEQVHLGGHTDMGTHLFDTHSKPVADPVWKLFERLAPKLRDVPILIEWDEDIPTYERLEEEAARAVSVWEASHGARRASAALR